MSLTNFSDHQKKEITKNPHLHLDKIDLSESDYYYSPIGSTPNGIYEWNSLSDESFRIVDISALFEDEDFRSRLATELFENKIKIEVNDEASLNRALIELYDQTLGYGLSFTLLNVEEFNKEFLYYNAKRKNRT